MKAILDTNVVVSGIFFGGIPRRILELGQKRVFTNVISHEILDEYTEVVKRVGEHYSVSQAEKILDSAKIAQQTHGDSGLKAALHPNARGIGGSGFVSVALGRCPFAKPQNTVHLLHGTTPRLLAGTSPCAKRWPKFSRQFNTKRAGAGICLSLAAY